MMILKVSGSCEERTIFLSVSTIYEEKLVQQIVSVRGLLISLEIQREVSVIFSAALCYIYIERIITI